MDMYSKELEVQEWHLAKRVEYLHLGVFWVEMMIEAMKVEKTSKRGETNRCNKGWTIVKDSKDWVKL